MTNLAALPQQRRENYGRPISDITIKEIILVTPNNPRLPIERLNLDSVRRQARSLANDIVMRDDQLDALLAPVRHHPSGHGARRADQLRLAYSTFVDMTVDQIVGSAAVPQGHLDNWRNDITRRSEQVNESFRLLACHAIAELTDPTPLPALPLRPAGPVSGMRPDNASFGPANAADLAQFTVDRIHEKSNHFWNSVLKRVNAERGCVRWNDRDDDYDGDYDDDDYDCPDLNAVRPLENHRPW